jgi:hypothetical protein
MTATSLLMLMGPIVVIVGIITLLDYVGYRQREKARKS